MKLLLWAVKLTLALKMLIKLALKGPVNPMYLKVFVERWNELMLIKGLEPMGEKFTHTIKVELLLYFYQKTKLCVDGVST